MDDDHLRMLADDLRKRTEALQITIKEKVGCDEVLTKLADLRQRLSRLPGAPHEEKPE